ncbi:hypothetical protein GCM10007989_24630 [Devosia pacifica]|uniref:EAL domain-containing protein n=1 Tax=Devosia pacifica TaxID=1335967 RepID=A0A918S9L6_9HYPH|nr:EAL domain-containing protein [Devosia pacifica]GHA27810.1 hypothetical protein GCM10007989_24630 [Devosia pacifica]
MSIFPDDGVTSERLISNADLAMYRAKGANDVTPSFFEQSMDDAARERRVLAHEMRRALETGQFYLNFQQQHAVRNNAIVGYEALLRWRHPQKGLVPPDVFIPIAEESGLILDLGAWVLQQACAEAVTWQVHQKIAVNISPLQLTNPTLVDNVREALQKSGLDPSQLELEVTETAIISDRERVLPVLQQLHGLGVTIAIDDFGTGYSSLATLNSFSFDRIKVDRSFVTNLAENSRSHSMLRTILALGKSLQVSVLVEGVETVDQLTILAQEGCAEVQGFIYGQPAPLADLLHSVGLPHEEASAKTSS